MSDEDSKFSFSERTRVDEGDAARSPDDPTPHDEVIPVVEDAAAPDAVEWFYERGQGQEGPTTTEGLRAMLDAGELTSGNKIWRDGLVAWTSVSEFESLLAGDLAGDAPDDGEAEGDVAGKTGVLSSNELKEAGILGSETPLDVPEVTQQESDSQTYVARTMMLDPSISDDATVAQVQAIDHVDESASDATVAEVTAIGPEVGEGSEATVALVEAIPEAPEPVIFRLALMGGSKGTQIYEIRGPHQVAGRHVDCDLVIPDSSVSRRHFELTQTGDGYRLKDLGSGNGTLVDGEAVTEILLKHGMVIEAGITRLQWQDPRAPKAVAAESEAEKTQMIDIADLQHDPSFSPDRRPASKPAPQRPAPQSIERPRTDNVRRPNRENTRTSRHTRPETSQVLQWVGLCALGLLALVGALSLLGLLPTGDEAASEGGQQVATSDAGSAVLMSEGLEAFKAWRWADARRLFEAARDQATDPSGAQDALSRVAQEELASKVMETVRVSMESNRYQEAIKKLGEVPDTSVYFGDAQALINDAKEGIVSQHLEAARKLSGADKQTQALEELEAALALMPGDAEVVALMREYQEATAKPERRARKTETPRRREARSGKSSAPRRPAAKRRSKSNFELEPDWPEDAPAAQAAPAPLDMTPALSKYSAGKFSDAKRILERVMRNTDSERQRAKAKRLISDIRAFQNLWETGNSEAASENLSGAISSLKRAKVLDKAISGAYKRRIDRLLANQYATQANNAMLAGKHARAGSLARKALAISSGQSVARAVMEEVRKKADGWLSSAESQLSSNPDKAKTLLTQVLAVFPKRDPRYIRAYGMLKRIDVEDDD
jgi:tetratricopeptide (TPR) repeat protein